MLIYLKNNPAKLIYDRISTHNEYWQVHRFLGYDRFPQILQKADFTLVVGILKSIFLNVLGLLSPFQPYCP